jgi:hypothetical protein
MVAKCAVNVFGKFASLCSFHAYIMKLLELGVRLDMGGRWVRDEGTHFVCYSCRCLASWWIQARYSRLNLNLT